jgi:hypothetical protein
MSSNIAKLLAFGALASASSMSWAVGNSCLVTIGVLGNYVVGVHSINVDAPSYDEWAFSGKLKKEGVVEDSFAAVDPEQGPLETTTVKINCYRYEARTEAVIDGPGVPEFACTNNRFITPDTRPSSC